MTSLPLSFAVAWRFDYHITSIGAYNQTVNYSSILSALKPFGLLQSIPNWFYCDRSHYHSYITHSKYNKFLRLGGLILIHHNKKGDISFQPIRYIPFRPWRLHSTSKIKSHHFFITASIREQWLMLNTCKLE